MSQPASVATAEHASAGRPPLPAALGWTLVGLVVVYTAIVHQGLGPPPNGMATKWWHADGFMRDTAMIGGLVGRPRLGILALCLPAGICTLLIFLSTRSAVARTIGICSFVTIAIMAFYGLTNALRIWEFFHWRGSVVIIGTGIGVGCTVAAPVLAGSWMRLGGFWKVVTYLPFFFLTASIIRNATGTDESLFFNFSPWPAIPVLGLEIGSYAIIGVMFGLALGVAGFAHSGRSGALRALALAAGAILPVLWFYTRFSQTEPPALFRLFLASAAALALALVARSEGRQNTLRLRSTHLFVGAMLAALALFSGRALADGDYTVTRHVRAKTLTDALSDYYREHYEYPDSLDTLIEDGYLDELPIPRIGFQLYYQLGLLDQPKFDYASLGSSYILEFASTEWVMCAYNPPWEDVGEDEEEYEEEDMDEATEEAWTCPDKRPELW